jgi:hypothetical protein
MLVTQVCPGSGQVVVHNCTGFKGVMTSTCPRLEPFCAKLSVVDADFTPFSGCSLLSYNETATVCTCSLGRNADSSRRGLTVISDVMDYTGVTNIAAMSVYTGESFTSSFSASSDLTTADDLARVLIVMYMFATMWGAGLLLMAVCTARNDPRLSGLLKKKQPGSAAVAAEPVLSAEDDPKQRFMRYIEEVIPQVYADGRRNAERVFAELCSHHRYMTLFTLGDGQITFHNKMIILLKLLTVDTMQMFLLAVLYDLQCQSDDGSCIGFTTEDQCLARKTVLDSSQSYCQWRFEETQYRCSYQVPHNSAWTFIYVFVIVSMVTSVCNIPIDYLFGVCAAPTEASLSNAEILGRVSTQAATILRNARRLSSVAIASIQPVVSRGKGALEAMSGRQASTAKRIDREVSEDLRRRHGSVVQLLQRISIQASVRESNRKRTAEQVRFVAMRRHSSRAFGAQPGAGELSKDAVAIRPAVETEDLESPSPRTATAFTLFAEVTMQRLLLSGDSVLEVFDAQWGIVPSVSNPCVYELTATARQAIQATIEEADHIAEEVNAQMPNYTAQHAGLTILHLFMQDLLGRNTPAAKIFSSKFEENFAHTRAVSEWSKAAAWGCILLSNAFFVYYSLLKAFIQGRAWQQAYITACLVQVVVEIFLNETIECLWLNYWVPSLVRSDVGKAVEVLKHATEDVALDEVRPEGCHRVFLDAPSYLFASTKVAQRNEELLESLLVKSYHSHLPGELCKTWPHYMQSRLNLEQDQSRGILGRFPVWAMRIIALALATMTALVQWSGTLSFAYQRVFIRVIQPMVFSGLTMLCYLFTSVYGGYLLVAVSLLLAAGAVIWLRQSGNKEAAQQRQRIAQAVDEDNDLEQELAVLRSSSTRPADSSSSSSGWKVSECTDEWEEFSEDRQSAEDSAEEMRFETSCVDAVTLGAIPHGPKIAATAQSAEKMKNTSEVSSESSQVYPSSLSSSLASDALDQPGDELLSDCDAGALHLPVLEPESKTGAFDNCDDEQLAHSFDSKTDDSSGDEEMSHGCASESTDSDS